MTLDLWCLNGSLLVKPRRMIGVPRWLSRVGRVTALAVYPRLDCGLGRKPIRPWLPDHHQLSTPEMMGCQKVAPFNSAHDPMIGHGFCRAGETGRSNA